mgnify:CR=1 FL=1
MWNIDEFLSGLNIDLDRLRDVFTYDPQAPMIFSSGIFLWLFVAFILVYLLLQRRTTARLLFVTLFSPCFPITSIIKVVALISSCLDW